MRDRQKMLAGFDSGDSETLSIPTEEPVSVAVPVSPPKVTPEEPISVAGKSVYVVDSHSLIYQVFHAMPEMTGPNGQPVGAIHGFIRDVLDLIETKKPDFLFCAFDASGVTFRNDVYDQYKANRSEMPDDLRPQIADIQRMLTALGVPTLSCPNYEADDILATIARQTESLGGTCVLVTGDKDCRQLITEHTRVYNIRKDEMFDAELLERDWGIRPDQVIDFQSLVGDSVDNVPGVAKCGPKTAVKWLAQYGTLDALVEKAGEVGGVVGENLRQALAFLPLGKKLVTIQTGPAGQTVNQVFIEEGCQIARELYLGIVLDRAAAKPVLMVSTEGGVEIENVAQRRI